MAWISRDFKAHKCYLLSPRKLSTGLQVLCLCEEFLVLCVYVLDTSQQLTFSSFTCKAIRTCFTTVWLTFWACRASECEDERDACINTKHRYRLQHDCCIFNYFKAQLTFYTEGQGLQWGAKVMDCAFSCVPYSRLMVLLYQAELPGQGDGSAQG